jgi:hypothetical protein
MQNLCQLQTAVKVTSGPIFLHALSPAWHQCLIVVGSPFDKSASSPSDGHPMSTLTCVY